MAIFLTTGLEVASWGSRTHWTLKFSGVTEPSVADESPRA